MTAIKLTYRHQTNAIGIHHLSAARLSRQSCHYYLYGYEVSDVIIEEAARDMLLRCPDRSEKRTNGLEFFSNVYTIGWASVANPVFIPLINVSVGNIHHKNIAHFRGFESKKEDASDEFSGNVQLLSYEDRRLLCNGPWRPLVEIDISFDSKDEYRACVKHQKRNIIRSYGNFSDHATAYNRAREVAIFMNRNNTE